MSAKQALQPSMTLDGPRCPAAPCICVRCSSSIRERPSTILESMDTSWLPRLGSCCPCRSSWPGTSKSTTRRCAACAYIATLGSNPTVCYAKCCQDHRRSLVICVAVVPHPSCPQPHRLCSWCAHAVSPHGWSYLSKGVLPEQTLQCSLHGSLFMQALHLTKLM